MLSSPLFHFKPQGACMLSQSTSFPSLRSKLIALTPFERPSSSLCFAAIQNHLNSTLDLGDHLPTGKQVLNELLYTLKSSIQKSQSLRSITLPSFGLRLNPALWTPDDLTPFFDQVSSPWVILHFPSQWSKVKQAESIEQWSLNGHCRVWAELYTTPDLETLPPVSVPSSIHPSWTGLHGWVLVGQEAAGRCGQWGQFIFFQK